MTDRMKVPQIWTASQRAVLVTFILIFAAFLAFRIYWDRNYVARPQREDAPRAAEVLDRIDPNTADLATLSILPGLGEKRAKEIIAYRDEFHRTRPNEVPFRTQEDLLKVKGMGVSMMENLSPYLSFPSTQPVTRP
jgi:competence ComEA-like helix-hairpin-helix protein